MTETLLTLRTTIRPYLVRHALLRGAPFYLCGGFLLLFSGAYFSVETLSRWGFFIFLVGMCLIAFGLLPNRRLRQLENTPSKIAIDNEGKIHYFKNGNALLSIPLDHIEFIRFKEGKEAFGFNKEADIYGIEIGLKEETESKRQFFFPYFSKRSFDELFDFLNQSPD